MNQDELKKMISDNQYRSDEMSAILMAEILCAKFYHDMSGPITAIDNSIEFLEDSNQSLRQKAFDLIKSSSRQSVSRLVFYRRAYGVIKTQGDANLEETKTLVRNFFSESKVEINWPDSDFNAPGIDFSNKMAKVLMNFMIIISSNLIFGGSVFINAHKDSSEDSVVLKIKALSDQSIISDDSIIKIIENNVDDVMIDTKNIQAFYMLTICKEIGATINICSKDEKHIDYEIKFR